MATEQEELRLVVTLDDQASAQLGNLRATLASMSQGVAQAGANIGGSAQKAHAGVAQLQGGLLGLVAKGTFIGNMLTGMAKEIGHLGTEIVGRATDLEGLTREMLNMSNAARVMGTNTAQLRNNLQAFREAGVPLNEAQKALQGIAETFVDLQFYGSQTRQALMVGDFLPIEKMRAFADEMQRTKNADQLAEVIRRVAAATREYNTLRYGKEMGASEEQRVLAALKAQGIERTKQAHEASAFQKQLDEDRAAASAAFTVTAAKTSEAYERTARSMGFILEHMLAATGAAGAWSRMMDKIASDMENIESRLRTANETADKAAAAPGFWGGLNPFNPANVAREGAVAPNLQYNRTYNPPAAGGTPQHFMGGGATYGPYSRNTGGLGGFLPGSSESENIEDRRTQDDNTQETRENTAEIKRLNDSLIYSTQMGGLEPGLGGGLASKLGIGDIGGGGGGFRFPGGGSGPGIGSGGGGTDSGGAATHAGGAGGGAGVAPGIQAGTPSGSATYQKMLAAFQGSSVIGKVPPGGAKFGITTGSAEEWARFGTAVAKAESSFNPNTKNTSDPGGSFGILQYAHNQVPGGNAYNVDSSIQAFVRDATTSVNSEHGLGPASLLGRRFSTIGSYPERTARNLANYDSTGQPAAGTPQFFAGSGQPVKQMTEAMAPAGSRVGAGAPGGTSIITTASGRNIRVASDYAANFQGFLRDYEAAGGVAGPNTGGLAGRPGNASYHPRGMAIDLNQIGYGVRGGGTTLPQAQEDALAAKWGLFPGSQFSSRSDIGHFEVRNRAAALAAQQRNLPGAGTNQATPVTVVGVAPEASRTLSDSNATAVKAAMGQPAVAAAAAAAAVRAGASPETAAAAGAAAAAAAGGTMDKPGGLPTGHRPEPEAMTEEGRLRANIARLEQEQTRAETRTGRARTRGVGGEAAPIGGAAQPETVPIPRADPRTGKVMSRTPGVGGEPNLGASAPVTPEGRAALRRMRRSETAAERRERELVENRKRLDEVERQNEEKRQERIAEDAKIDESPAERLERLQGEGTRRRRAAEDPEGELDRQLGRKSPDVVSGYSSGTALDGSGRGIDAGRDAIKVQSDGTLTVNVRSQKGVDVAAKGEGSFKKTVTNRQTQMEPAESGPNHSPDLDS